MSDWSHNPHIQIYAEQAEKRRIADLEGQIKTAQLKVLEQKQKTGGVNASKENDAVIAKQIRLLENHLDKELVKFNQALSEVGGFGSMRVASTLFVTIHPYTLPPTHPTQNKNLRERIDRLRKDRVIFDNVYKRLERCLHEKKNEMVGGARVGVHVRTCICMRLVAHVKPLTIQTTPQDAGHRGRQARLHRARQGQERAGGHQAAGGEGQGRVRGARASMDGVMMVMLCCVCTV